ncbi:MAG: hypothetical protein GC157_00315 [Frankiales bacterium]|nr:hypothetical protein [Frankiales bacterium]
MPRPSDPRRDDEHVDDRALDRLADRGPSRVGVEGAMRARDVSRPAPAALAAAGRSVTVRRARQVER